MIMLFHLRSLDGEYSFSISLYFDLFALCTCTCLGVSDSLWLHRLSDSLRLLCPWCFPGKNDGVGCHFLPQGIFPTQGSNMCLYVSPALAGGFFTPSTTWEDSPGKKLLNVYRVQAILKGMTEDEMAGWHHRLDGPEFEWTPGVGDGQGGLACWDSWGRKELDTTERLNWTELNTQVSIVLFLLLCLAAGLKGGSCISSCVSVCVLRIQYRAGHTDSMSNKHLLAWKNSLISNFFPTIHIFISQLSLY